MMRLINIFLLGITGSILVGTSEHMNSEKSFQNFTFQLDKSWPDSTVKSLRVFGSSVAIDSRNNVIVLHRGSARNGTKHDSTESLHDVIQEDVVLLLDSKSGSILATWGMGKFVKPHSITISEDDDIFITDVTLHQVFKYRKMKDGLWMDIPEVVLGERFVSGNDNFHFCSPADVAIVRSTKDFFVADGYCNSRVVKFDNSGSYLGEFGAGSVNPAFLPVPFNVTHSVVVAEPFSSPNILFVADRNNGRIQCFFENGSLLYEIGYGNFLNTKEMVLGLAYTNLDSANVSVENEPFGVLYAVNGHLPLGKPRVFEILVSYSRFKVINSFPTSNPKVHSNILNVEDDLKIEVPHNIALSKGSQALYIIDANQNLTIKRFITVSPATGVATSGSISGVSFIFTIVAINILRF